MLKEHFYSRFSGIDIPQNKGDDPFVDDKLQRIGSIAILTELIEAYTNGAVISLNGCWGSGKTIFVKLWQAYLTKKRIPICLFQFLGTRLF